ncbi:1,4-alpha-glucan branching protein GlgB [Anaerostipes sp.]|uniref:1,4-alpha-glucan branching protein GlgB n=1 Tax=Anaerostipes sp. TaxID=1872530 RepID=UPI002E77CA89|nr:1,4-alpha-glucan branching protein GlgB [Anaerostipes sp.]MED9814448.1 1,4-alpha-glucan branching protein GlgB [Anaerostipes sp.]
MSETINREDLYLFQTGKARQAYLTFGCHYQKKTKTHRFTVWAPNAKSVSVVGDFNFWNPLAHPMKGDKDGIYTIEIEGLKKGDLYKYYVEGYDGICRYKSDPFAFYAECRPDTASKVWDFDDFKWSDKRFINQRKKRQAIDQPMSIYELHLGTWRMPQEEEREFYNYREIADMLIPYLQKMGYTHVELMPITEYPYDLSWGYQVTGYYGVTSRYGTPEDFNYMINELHKAGISVILDWVPAHFPRDEHGLAMFDGTHIYDHEDPRKGSQPDWGTLLFNYGKPEVQSFLISSAMFFADIYHVDGIRIDAVSAMLYLDFGKQEGEYVPNEDGTNINYEAVDFLHNLNEALRTTYEGFLTIAEESTAYPKVTSDIDDPDGLGFVYKWNMGYMHDSLYYMELDPLYRKDNHGAIIFSMDYAYSENYILPYSHDEVVHGKGSMINKMYGAYDEKFASLRTLYGFTIAHPGKKLLFMGGEFAQFVEWRDKEQLDWFLIDQYEMHDSFHEYVAKLNEIYKAHPAFYELDQDPAGFEWCLQRDADHSVVAFIRKSKRGRGRKQEQILCVCNFTPMEWDKYQIPLPKKSKLTKILDSSELNFGGDGDVSETKVSTKRVKVPSEGKVTYQQCAQISLKPLSVVYYKIEEVEKKPRKTAAKKTEAAKKVTKEVVEETKAEETKTVKSTTKVVAKTKKAEPIKKAVQEKKPAPKSETSKKEDTKETTETVTKEKEQPKKKARKTRRTNKNKNQGVK